MKQNYPEAYSEGTKLGETLYERGLDRDGAFNYAKKCCRFRTEAEEDSYLSGFMESYDWEEKHDIKVKSDLILEEDE